MASGETQTPISREFASVLKADDEKRIVYGIALQPEVEDSQGDVVSADEIEKAAHDWLLKSRLIGDSHRRPAKAEVVESFIAPVDMEIGGQQVKKGSWVMGIRIQDPNLWAAVKEQEYTGLSIGGFAVREQVV